MRDDSFVHGIRVSKMEQAKKVVFLRQKSNIAGGGVATIDKISFNINASFVIPHMGLRPPSKAAALRCS